jgi:imidazole glycerol-phosphate synthase subunit HisH
VGRTVYEGHALRGGWETLITLVDYGLGNVQAFVNIYRRLNVQVSVAASAAELASAERLILPGVGSFDWAISLLSRSGMRDCLDDLVLLKRRPVLGVCVGMQMMAHGSEEGKLPGLGWIDGDVRRLDLDADGMHFHLPHMGWNDVQPVSPECLFRELPAPRFYFLHSYYFAPASASVSLGRTVYGGSFTSAVRAGHIFGTQFHPEKSHGWGVQLLKNFAELPVA